MTFSWPSNGNLGTFHTNLGDPSQQSYINGANTIPSGHGSYCNGSCPQTAFAHTPAFHNPAYQNIAHVDTQFPTANTLNLPSGISNDFRPQDALTRQSSTQNSISTQSKEFGQREQSVLCLSTDGMPEVDEKEDYDSEELDMKARLEHLCLGYRQLLRIKKSNSKKMVHLEVKVEQLEARILKQEKYVCGWSAAQEANVRKAYVRIFFESRTLL